MSLHNQRSKDSGSVYAGSKAGTRRKPRVYVMRTSGGAWIAKDDNGKLISESHKFIVLDAECKALGFAPVRFPEGDAPKTK